MLRILVVAAAFGAVFAVAEAIHTFRNVSSEVTRKVVHIVSGLLAAALPSFLTFGQVIVVGLSFAVFMTFSKWFGLLPSISDVRRATLGEVFFPLGVAAAAAIATDWGRFAFGVLVMGISDGLAGLVGQRWGRKTYRLVWATKSYLGSATFAASTAVLGVATLASDGITGTELAAAGLAAFALTAVEGVLPAGADNLVLPPLAILILFGLAALIS